MVERGEARCGPARARHTGRHIILMRDSLGKGGIYALHKIAGLRVGLSSDNEGSVRGHQVSAGEGVLFHRLGAGLVHVDPDQLVARRAQVGGDVVSIEPERIVRAIQVASDASTPSEALDTWGVQTTRVAQSRFSGRGVRIAVLDTGLDLQHPDFVGRSIVSQSFVAGESVDDANGHGTYCAGVAGGPSSPLQPPRYGVAGDAELFIGKVIGDDGSGADGNILAGIDWAVRYGCVVVSLSVGTPVAPGEPYSP